MIEPTTERCVPKASLTKGAAMHLLAEALLKIQQRKRNEEITAILHGPG